jgi:hypothetical protein
LALGIVVFPKQSWAVIITWFAVGFGVITWNTVRLRRVRQQAGISPATNQSNVVYLRRIVPSLIVGGAAFLLLGVTVMTLAKGGPTTAHLVWGSVLLLAGVATLIGAAFLRFRRPPTDTNNPGLH